MNNSVKIASIFFLILIINIAGVLLKYYGLDAYFILAGFRFYISLVVPFFMIYRFSMCNDIKKILVQPSYNKTFQPLGWIFLPLIILFASLYFFKQIEVGDPDYFYEFGLSSIFDYPLYIIWNLPQLLLFAVFLILVQPLIKFNLFFSFLIALSCFMFIFISFNKIKTDYFEIISLVLILALAVLIVKYFQNVYWFSIILFTILWSNILAFGSSSQTMIHLLFASKYDIWGGFFDVSKNIQRYLLPAQLGITLVLIACSVLLRKTKPDIV
jgi:hypothetical protein